MQVQYRAYQGYMSIYNLTRLFACFGYDILEVPDSVTLFKYLFLTPQRLRRFARYFVWIGVGGGGRRHPLQSTQYVCAAQRR